MATKLIFGYLLLFYANFICASVFDNILDDVTSCKDVCKNTFTPHTFEKSNSEECCQRGCRLFSMMEFIYDDVNKTTQVCQASCEEAYLEKEESEACKLGCKSQKPFAIENLLKEDPWEQHIHLVNPVTFIHQWYSNVFSNIISQASVSWTMYMRDSDGSVIVVKSPKEFHVYDLGGLDGASDSDYNTASYVETNIEPMDNSATPFLKNSPYKAHRNDEDLLDLSVHDFNRNSNYGSDEYADWLTCVARKTGMPRLLLSWLLLMCAIVMIWLCLSAAVTSPEQRILTEPQKLSINGDEEVIEEMLARGIKPSYPQQEKGHLESLPIKISVHRI